MLVAVFVVLVYSNLRGLRTSKRPGVPAYAALVTEQAVSVVVLPSGNTKLEESRYVYRIPRTAVRLRLWVRVQACVGDTSRNGHIRRIAGKGVLGVYRRCLLLILDLSRSTPSSLNLTVCAHYGHSQSTTLRLMSSDGLRKRVEHPSLGFRLHVRQSIVPTLKVIVGRGVAGRVRRLAQTA